MLRLAAKWILPITSPALEDGVVAVEGDSIAAVGPRRELPDVEVEDLGEAIVLPGLINAHTHLELSFLRGFMDRPSDLVAWILQLRRRQQQVEDGAQQEQVRRAIHDGVRECLDAGVSTVGDITRYSDLTRPLLTSGPLRVVSYGEVTGIGRHRHRLDERLQRAVDRRFQSPFLQTAVSPHAPYSIEEDGLRKVVSTARASGLPTCMHLAETVEEIQFLQTGQGRFRELLNLLELWDERITIPRLTPVRWVWQVGCLGPECVVAHANYLEPEEIDLLCASGASVAYCPRTHVYFGHRAHPLMELLGRGVNVCVGTDSLASSPSLSVLEDLVCLHETFPELPAEVVLALGTLNAARALGVARSVGSLEVGKKADVAVFACPAGSTGRPENRLLKRPLRLLRLYLNGDRVR